MSSAKQKTSPNGGWRIGLTGGMGCGKSTAAEIFRELGFGVLESDALVREMWQADEALKQAALSRWGGQIMDQDKRTFSRRKIADIVFADARELEWLESLLHPKVRAHWQAALAAEPRKNWVVEIPLLFEKSLAKEFDFTLCIASSPALQATRLAARGLSPAEITARQARQWPLQNKIERADWVALNDGTRDILRRQLIYFTAGLRQPAT